MSEDLLQRAEAGDARAQHELGHRYSNGPIYPSPPKGGWGAGSKTSFFDDIPKDPVKGAFWSRRSAEQGYVPGMVSLISAIRQGGEGNPPDNVEVYKWALIASAHGMAAGTSHVEIIEGRGYLGEPRLSAAQLKEGQRRALLFRPVEE